MKLSLLFYLAPLPFLTITATLTSTSSPSSSSVSECPHFSEARYKRLGSGYSYSHILKTTTDHLIPNVSLIQCVATSATNQTEFFSYDRVKQICKIYSQKNILTVTTGQTTNEMDYYRRDGWIKVYALTMRANSLVYNSFINEGSPTSWKVEDCVESFCPNFFRHPILDIWKKIPIDEVKLVFSTNQTDVVTMVFNGRKTSITSWFSKENVRSTPWETVPPFYFFKMYGVGKNRRFYVHSEHAGCAADSGWLSIQEGFSWCQWETTHFYPIVMYSNSSKNVTWSKGFAVADSMAIYLSLGPE